MLMLRLSLGRLGALLSGLMGFICVGAAKLPVCSPTSGGLTKVFSLRKRTRPVARPEKLTQEMRDSMLETHYRHLILARESAFTTPASLAEQPGLFDWDHARAKLNWTSLRERTIRRREEAENASPEEKVLNLFRSVSSKPPGLAASTAPASPPASADKLPGTKNARARQISAEKAVSVAAVELAV
jgi:hypothetical protein